MNHLQKLREALLESAAKRCNGQGDCPAQDLHDIVDAIDKMKPWPTEEEFMHDFDQHNGVKPNGVPFTTPFAAQWAYRRLTQYHAPQPPSPAEDMTHCPFCGVPGKVEGNVTKSFVPKWTEDKEKLLAAYRAEAEAACDAISNAALYGSPTMEQTEAYEVAHAERVKLEGKE